MEIRKQDFVGAAAVVLMQQREGMDSRFVQLLQQRLLPENSQLQQLLLSQHLMGKVHRQVELEDAWYRKLTEVSDTDHWVNTVRAKNN